MRQVDVQMHWATMQGQRGLTTNYYDVYGRKILTINQFDGSTNYILEERTWNGGRTRGIGSDHIVKVELTLDTRGRLVSVVFHVYQDFLSNNIPDQRNVSCINYRDSIARFVGVARPSMPTTFRPEEV